VSPAIFNAVHSDFELQVARPVGRRFQDLSPNNFLSMTQADLLEEFMRSELPYARMAIFGESGSGKSHLIHWMKQQLPSNDQRLVLVVPKAGTSLRSIIEMIVSELPPEKQVIFNEVLAQQGDVTASRDAQKTRLLNELAYAIGNAQIADDSLDRELEQELITVLPYLFQDVYFRQQHFFQDNNIISDLIDHVFAAPTAYRPVADRRRFTEADLPMEAKDFGQAARLAQDALSYLYSIPEAPTIALSIVNRSLDIAIARALSFSGDRLIGLMEDLRRHLRQDGRELVLLIEDFARLQGLDRALLQAMIEQGVKDDLCKLRWAIAVTRGFFEQVVETVYMRMSFLVDMDRSAGRRPGRAIDAAGVAAFAGPYLNAVRAGVTRLELAYAKGETTPNRCIECGLKDECHQTFGATNAGFGLYPFTERALWNMIRRADERTEDAFNPRSLQTGVLAPVMDDHASSLRDGQFPPAALLTELGEERKLGVRERGALAIKAGAEAPRWNALLELWDGSGAIVNLSPGILEAFSIKPLSDTEVQSTDEETRSPLPQNQPKPASRPKEEEEIERWANGAPIGERTAEKLRELIYPAVSDTIDWDDIGLEATYFSSASGSTPFRRRSISFARQVTNTMTLPVMLQIPGSDTSREQMDKTARALIGLLRSEAAGDWEFENGGAFLADYLDCLAGWRAMVIDQMRVLTHASDTWDIAVASAELLVIAGTLTGKIKFEADLKNDAGVLLAASWPSEIATQAPLQKVYSTIAAYAPNLRRVLRALNSGSKGGQVGTLISPLGQLEALKRLRASGWRLQQSPPTSGSYDEFKRIAELYRRTAEALPVAAEHERAGRLTWIEKVEAAFGPAPKRSKIVQALSEARAQFADAGLAASAAANLGQALETFGSRLFDDAFAAAMTLKDAGDATAALPAYARAKQPAIEATNDLIAATERFVTHAQTALDEKASQQTAQEQAVARDIVTIEQALDSIAAHLALLEDDHAA